MSNPLAQTMWAQFRPIEKNAALAATPASAAAQVTTGAPLNPSNSVAAVVSAGSTLGTPVAVGALAETGGQLIGTHTAQQLVISRDGRRAYVVVTAPATDGSADYLYFVQQVNLSTQQPIGERIPFSGRISSLALTQQGDRLYVATADGRGGAVTTIDTRTNVVKGAPVTLENAQPLSGMTVSSDGNTIYLAAGYTGAGAGNGGNGDVFALNTTSGSVTVLPRTYPIPTGPVSLDEASGRVYSGVTDGTFTYGQIGVADLHSGRAAPVYVGNSPADMMLSPDGQTLYVLLNQGGVVVVDTSSLAVTKSYSIPLLNNTNKQFALSADGKYFSVAGITEKGPTVVEIDTATGEIVGAVTALGYVPNSLRYSPDGRTLYAAGTSLDSVYSGGYLGTFTTAAGHAAGSTGPSSGDGGTTPAADPFAAFFDPVSGIFRQIQGLAGSMLDVIGGSETAGRAFLTRTVGIAGSVLDLAEANNLKNENKPVSSALTYLTAVSGASAVGFAVAAGAGLAFGAPLAVGLTIAAAVFTIGAIVASNVFGV